MAKAESSITVKVIPTILGPVTFRETLIDGLTTYAPITHDTAAVIADKVLAGTSILTVDKEDVEEPVSAEGRDNGRGNPASAEPWVWGSIYAVPLGVKVRGRESDVFWWDEDYELWWTSPWWSDPYGDLNRVWFLDADFNSKFGPFTEVVE
ncbi:hypothetical protein SEA_PEPE_36 [Mycobacterium phage Pepe]|uniref:hypothetical protein n=1 Tax=Mycobacterium phage Pepe TaxID=1735466 RepID=UPI000706A1A3|nr:hypothetical protein SEA_PEPE_36 [Mycobacterium phage Pepe]ALK87010.1 hypothetical protein SEA_PEPE_36 [Mycobacterium phage Pepe]